MPAVIAANSVNVQSSSRRELQRVYPFNERRVGNAIKPGADKWCRCPQSGRERDGVRRSAMHQNISMSVQPSECRRSRTSGIVPDRRRLASRPRIRCEQG
jgi:hypothetical protein